MGRPALSWSLLVAKIKKDAVDATQVAGELLCERLKQLVSVPCPVTHGEGAVDAGAEILRRWAGHDTPGSGHSPPGGPPYMETGEGRDSIEFRRARDGFRIGVRDLGENLPGGNHMIFLDLYRNRPWISNWRQTFGASFHMDMRTALRRGRAK